MNTYRLYIACLLLSLLLISCDKKGNTAVQADEIVSPYDTIVLPKLSGLKPTLRLTPEAQTVTENWIFYQEIAQAIDSLGAGTIGQTKKQVTRFSKTYANLKESQAANVDVTPIEFTTQPIRARLAALETQLMVLKNEVGRNEPSSKRIAASIVKSKNALQDLNLQIDERFALSIEEMLKAANETPDSLITKSVLQSTIPQN